MSIPPQVVPTAEPPSKAACDALVIGAFSSRSGVEPGAEGAGLDPPFLAELAEALGAQGFKAQPGEVFVAPTFGRIGPAAIAVAGLGDKGSSTGDAVRRAAGAAARKLAERPVIASVIHRQTGKDFTAEAVEGFLLGGYRFGAYKSDSRTSTTQRILFFDSDRVTIARAVVAAQATILARDLVNEPPERLTPAILAERAQEIADVGGL